MKAIHELAPSLINELVKIKPLNSRYRLRSNNGILLSHPNFKTLTTLGDRRAFVALAPELWSGTIHLWKLEWLNLLTLVKKCLKSIFLVLVRLLFFVRFFDTIHNTWCNSYLPFSYFYFMYCHNAQLFISSWKLRNINS